MKSKAITTTILFMAGIFILALDVVPVAATPDNGIVGLWHFDKEFGTALEFDGDDDYISIPSTLGDELDITSSFTLEAWIEYTGDQTETYYPRIVEKSYAASYFLGLFHQNTTRLTLWIDGVPFVEPSPGSVTPGQWHHVAAVFNDSTNDVKLYVDGGEVYSGSYTGTITGSGNDVLIGKYFGDSGGEFTGIIDEVRISDVARTSFDLTGPLTADSNTVALWHFDEGLGDTALDASPYNNHGSLENMDPGTWVDTTLAPDVSTNDNFGTIYGAAWTTGKFGGALEFDGTDDYVRVSHASELNPTSEITVECWTKFDRVDDHQVLVRKMNTYSLQVSVGLNGAGARLEGWIKIGGVWKGVRGVAGGCLIESEKWYHLAFTYDGTTLTTYVDGMPDRSNSFTGVIDSTANDIDIGRCGPPETTYCHTDGIIDEVRIWDQVLTDGQIQASYDLQNGTQIKEKDLDDDGYPDVLFTSAFYNLVDGNTIILTMLPVNPFMSIASPFVTNHRVTPPKRTYGHIEYWPVSASGYSVRVTVYNQDSTNTPCKSIHMWLWLITGDHVGVNAQFER